MIWLLPPNRLKTVGIDELEQQSRQWGMISSLALLSAMVLFFTTKLDSLPELAGHSMDKNVVNLEFRIMKPQPLVPVVQPHPEPVSTRQEVVEEPRPQEIPKVVKRIRKEKSEPVRKLKPVVTKKKVARPKKKNMQPAKKQPMPPVKQQVTADQPAAQPAPAPVQSRDPAVYEQAMLDTIPAAVSKKKPAYPYRARRLGITGSVEIRFLVDTHGIVQTVQIIRAAPKNMFEKTVRKTVAGWRFSPGIKNGRRVSTWMTTTINFELE